MFSMMVMYDKNAFKRHNTKDVRNPFVAPFGFMLKPAKV